MKLKRYAEKRLRASGFHRTLLNDHSGLVKRFRMDAQMGGQDPEIEKYVNQCKTPLDYAKVFLKFICQRGISEDFFGFNTSGFFFRHLCGFLKG